MNYKLKSNKKITIYTFISNTYSINLLPSIYIWWNQEACCLWDKTKGIAIAWLFFTLEIRFKEQDRLSLLKDVSLYNN